VDAEPNQPLPRETLRTLLDADELTRSAHLRTVVPAVHWDRLVFCIKESVYKAWSTHTDQWLDFADADVTPATGGTFTARLRVTSPGPLPQSISGRWACRGGLLLTVVALDHSGQPVTT